jgi:hypothetical protein
MVQFVALALDSFDPETGAGDKSSIRSWRRHLNLLNELLPKSVSVK